MTDPARSLEEWEALWPHVERLIPSVQARAAELVARPRTEEDYARMEAKAALGWVEHRGGILRMDADQIMAEALAEIDDLLVYLAFHRMLCLAD